MSDSEHAGLENADEQAQPSPTLSPNEVIAQAKSKGEAAAYDTRLIKF